MSNHPLPRSLAYSLPRVVAVFTLSVVALGCSEKTSTPSAASPAAETQTAGQQIVAEEMAASGSTETASQPVTKAKPDQVSQKYLEMYQQTCGSCHERGLVGAPRTGDVEAWKPRMAKGMDTLVAHARDGFKAMPPAGLCFSCTDEDYVALIEYMASPK
ncbi:c-type cytochrome [Microbulbifer agarilyticus]|uniref:c-type cytochrome n=1 Tax=Microbulbifer agarilyticus TaxID=260552 RepID=UPI001CD3A1B0|nr:c-type cytochrome [Microbulbifer agarilyticus]MCA0894392.1 c-type cytochrome [Microbulbifer agarilyticus]